MKHAEMLVGDMSGIEGRSQLGMTALLQQDGTSSFTGFEGEISAALRTALPGDADIPPEFAARILETAVKSSKPSFAQEAPGEAARDADMMNRKPGGQEAYTSQA